MIRAAGLEKRYGDKRVLRGLDFELGRGGFLVVTGPNGAGKTTLLEAMVGLIPTDGGDVFRHGEPLPAALRRNHLFYLPDGVRPYRDRAAIDVVSFFARVFHRSIPEIAAVVGAVGLSPALDKRVHALSKGFARRLMLALGLLTRHQLLLMDEPFDGFDLRQTREIAGVLRNNAADGRTFILAIHQLSEAERICDRFILLAEGRVRSVGTLSDLRDRAMLPAGSLEDIFLALT